MTDAEKLWSASTNAFNNIEEKSMFDSCVSALEEQVGKCQNEETHDGSVPTEQWEMAKELLDALKRVKMAREHYKKAWVSAHQIPGTVPV